MKYTLNFLLKLVIDDSNIVYNPEDFAEEPISISVPEVVEIFKLFIESESFEKVGIVEKKSNEAIISKKLAKTDNNNSNSERLEAQAINHTNSLKGLIGSAYILKSEKLDKDTLNVLCDKLSIYLKSCISKLNSENFLSEESSSDFAGLREVIESRNYLAMYTNTKKKTYREGYLYVMSI